MPGGRAGGRATLLIKMATVTAQQSDDDDDDVPENFALDGHIQPTFCDAASLDRKLNFSTTARRRCMLGADVPWSECCATPHDARESAGGPCIVPGPCAKRQ